LAGEDRLMSYESLSDGGCIWFYMLGSGGFILQQCFSCNLCHISLGTTMKKFVDNVLLVVKETGWMEKLLHESEE
jgi:NADH-quinone oxidoreductase subunit F